MGNDGFRVVGSDGLRNCLGPHPSPPPITGEGARYGRRYK